MLATDHTPVIERVCLAGWSDFVSDIITVPPYPWEGAKVGKCYNNVKELIRLHGGDYCYGWALTDFGPHRCLGLREPPALYRRWLNHVVWRDANGMLWEVSQNSVVDNRNQTEFNAT